MQKRDVKELSSEIAKPQTRHKWATQETKTTLPGIASLVAPTLYAFKLDDGVIKIGHTRQLHRRARKLGGLKNLLALKLGTREEEAALHKTLKPNLHHGREYYNPTPEIYALINQWRADMGLTKLTPPNA